jgi:hypothetical protein
MGDDVRNEFSGTAHTVVQAGSIERLTMTGPPAPPPEALAGLPSAPSPFTGRREPLRQLLAGLRPKAGPRGRAGRRPTRSAVRAWAAEATSSPSPDRRTPARPRSCCAPLREEADRVRGALGDLGLRPAADQRSRIGRLARSQSYAFGTALPVLVAGLALVPDAGDHPDEDHHAMDYLADLDLPPTESSDGSAADIDLVTDVIDESQDPVPDFGVGYGNDGDAAPDRSGAGGGGGAGGGDHHGGGGRDPTVAVVAAAPVGAATTTTATAATGADAGPRAEHTDGTTRDGKMR